MSEYFPCPTTEVVASNCTSFDCEASIAGFTFKVDGDVIDPASPEFDCSNTYSIDTPWLNCEGGRADGVITPLTVNGVGVQFVQAVGTFNLYTWTPSQSSVDVVYTFQWGKAPDICNLEVTVKACDTVVQKNLTSTDVFPTPIQQQTALPTPNNPITLSNGLVLSCANTAATHQYSTRSALNLDNTKFLDSTGNIYSLPNYNLLGSSGLNSETVWSYTNPDILYGIRGGTIQSYNCATNQYVDTGIIAVTIGAAEGGISADDQCITVETATQICIYNLQSPYNQIGCINKGANYDNHKISIDGQYVVVDNGSTGVIYNRDMTNPVTITQNFGHSVMAVDCNGDQVIVHKVNGAGAGTFGAIAVTVLSTGQSYTILPVPYTFNSGQIHFSYAPATPGVLYGSMSSGGTDWIGSIPICPNNTVVTPWSEGYADSPNNLDYPCQAKASVSMDGTKIVFTSCDADNVTPKDYVLSC